MNGVYDESYYNEVNNWNIGAMLCPFLWALGNKIDWVLSLLAFISLCNPLSALLVCVWFGMNGNKWALESNNFENIYDFKTLQKKWTVAIIGLYAFIYCIFALCYILN